MFPFENGQCLHCSSVPDVHGGVPANLPRSNVVVSRMKSQAQNVISVGGVEPLLVGGACVDHAQCCNMVDYVAILGIEKVVAAVVTTVSVRRKSMKIIVSLDKISIWDTENGREEGENYVICETSLSLETCQGKLTAIL